MILTVKPLVALILLVVSLCLGVPVQDTEMTHGFVETLKMKWLAHQSESGPNEIWVT
jgi:hypothetical protein